MKDEIKEINIPENVLVALGDLSNGALNYYKATETVKVRHNTILDYITNLQEENKELNRMCELYSKSLYNAELTDYKLRCEKAIEYIKSFYETPEYIDAYDITYWTDEVMKILNGGDEE